MNVFNRILVVTVLLVATIAGATALISPAFTIDLVQRLANLGRESMGELGAGLRFALRLVMAAVFVLLMALLLWLELRRPQAKAVEVQHAQSGKIKLGTADIQRQIGHAVEAIDGVRSTKVSINARNKSVAAHIEVVSEPGHDPVSKGEEIAETARAVIEDQLGLKMSSKPQVAITVGKPAKGVRMPPLSLGTRKPDAVLPAPAKVDDVIDAPGSART